MRSHSGTSGTSTENVSWSSSSEPPIEKMSNVNSPLSSFFFCATTSSTACSWHITRPRRVCPSWSNAPALTMDSMVRLLHTTAGTLARKSLKDVNFPCSLRASTMAWTTLAPTLRTAPMPKRMSVPTGVKFSSDSFTSGGSTVMPM